MKICEDCIKQDVCKFKKEVEGYESEVKLPKPLEPIIQCKHKRTEPEYWSYTMPTTTTTVQCPSVWTGIGDDPNYSPNTCSGSTYVGVNN